MAGLTSDQVIALRGNAYNRSITSYAIAIFGMVGTSWLVLAYGVGGSLPAKLLLLVIAGSVAAFAALALPAIWSELEGLRADKAEGLRGSSYEGRVDAQNYPLFGKLPIVASAAYLILVAWVLFC